MKLRPDPRPCLLGDSENKRRALFHGFSLVAYTHGAAATIGGFPAGQTSYAAAIVELESGKVLEVPVCEITLLDSAAVFGCFAF